MKRIKFVLGSLFGSLAFLPAFAFAQSSGNVPLTSLGAALKGIKGLMDAAVPLLIGAAIIVFLYGVLKFILNAGDPDKRTEGRSYMIWAIVGIVVMVSVWALVYFVQSTFGLEGGGDVQQGPEIPEIPNTR